MKNFIVVSGGPGIFDSADTAHDMSWSNFVDSVVLLAADGKFPKQKDEKVWWFIYKPAYEARWSDDEAKNRTSVKDVKNKSSKSYVDLLEKRASANSWNLRWLNKAKDFWDKLTTFSEPITRVWYFGHARNDLWLVISHDSSHNAITVSPEEETQIRGIDVNGSLASHFERGGHSRGENKTHKFFGCNTHSFAQKWSTKYHVWSMGYENTLDFKGMTARADRLPTPGAGCIQRIYKPNGSLLGP